VSFLSIAFAAFLACGLVIFYLAPLRHRPGVLLALSLAYYCTWSVWPTILLLGVAAIVYYAARLIEGSASQSRGLRLTTLTVTILLVVLVVFKCALALAAALHTSWDRPGFDAALWLGAPLGLSYYLFKLIGYLLDVYWGTLPARRDFTSVGLYAAFFPQIVSGPIQKAADFFTQLEGLGAADTALFVTGLRRILFGLFKKVVVADQLAVAVASVHTNTSAHSSLELLLGAYLFSLQMYADFSGLTDIAIGIGLLFGIRGPENFNRPYFAANLQDFWRRWHMSLTCWLTDYLFVPLRMSLRHLGTVGLALAIFINMVAIGVWHGPRWTYLVFGCINGVFMIVSALTLKPRNAYFRSRPQLSTLRTVLGTLVTFNLVVFTHVFFQAPDLPSALTYLGQLSHLLPHPVPATRLDIQVFGPSAARLYEALLGLAVMEWLNWAQSQPQWIGRFTGVRREVRWAAYYIVIAIVMLTARGTTSFIYAKF
jgi:alginate O-acetyltransferase complex protein AlgI